MDLVKNIKIDVNDVMKRAIKIPFVKIDRKKFLDTELRKYCSEETAKLAIQTTPKKAGLENKLIDKIANDCITLHTNLASAISFGAGIPGGLAMAATIPADLGQYFWHVIVICQKLAYIYGWPKLFTESQKIDEEFDSESSNIILGFMGIMFGVEGANKFVTSIATKMATANAGRHLAKIIAKQAFFQTAKEILKKIGIKLNQRILGQAISKSLPVVGGLISGGITYFSFKPQAENLKKSLSKCPQAD